MTQTPLHDDLALLTLYARSKGYPLTDGKLVNGRLYAYTGTIARDVGIGEWFGPLDPELCARLREIVGERR